MGEITTDKVINEINGDINYTPDWRKLYPKEKTALEEVKSFSNSLKYIVEDYELMRSCISVIYHALKEDIDVSGIVFRFKNNELRAMFMEILNDIDELKKRKDNDKSE